MSVWDEIVFTFSGHTSVDGRWYLLGRLFLIFLMVWCEIGGRKVGFCMGGVVGVFWEVFNLSYLEGLIVWRVGGGAYCLTISSLSALGSGVG